MLQTNPIEQTKGLFAYFWHDYSSFLPGMNWRNFCFVHVGFEYDPMMGQLEWEFCLLGLWYRGVYVYDNDTPMHRELREALARYDRDHAA